MPFPDRGSNQSFSLAEHPFVIPGSAAGRCEETCEAHLAVRLDMAASSSRAVFQM